MQAADILTIDHCQTKDPKHGLQDKLLDYLRDLQRTHEVEKAIDNVWKKGKVNTNITMESIEDELKENYQINLHESDKERESTRELILEWAGKKGYSKKLGRNWVVIGGICHFMRVVGIGTRENGKGTKEKGRVGK